MSAAMYYKNRPTNLFKFGYKIVRTVLSMLPFYSKCPGFFLILLSFWIVFGLCWKAWFQNFAGSCFHYKSKKKSVRSFWIKIYTILGLHFSWTSESSYMLLIRIPIKKFIRFIPILFVCYTLNHLWPKFGVHVWTQLLLQ